MSIPLHVLEHALPGIAEALGDDRYHMGAEVGACYDAGATVTAQMTDGLTVEADLLVAADGVASTARSLVLPDSEPEYAGYVAWRGAVNEWELSAASPAFLDEAITYHLMPAGHILAYPIPNVDGTVAPGRRRINWVWYRNVAAGADLDRLMTDTQGQRQALSLPPGRVRAPYVDDLRAAAVALPRALREMVMITAEPFIQVIVDVEVRRMVFGRMCLMGDAAFALRPHVAVGTAKAAEDAWQLARALRDDHGGEALREWEVRQVALGQQVLGRAREAGRRSQVEGSWRVGEPLPFGLYRVGDNALGPEIRGG